MLSLQSDSMDIFSVVTRNLLSLGSCPLEKLAGPSDEKFQSFDLPFLSSSITSRFDLPPTPTTNSSSSQKDLPNATDDQTSSSVSMKHVAQLHEICQQTFGNAEALKFEFIEEDPDREFLSAFKRMVFVFRSLPDGSCAHFYPRDLHSSFAICSLTQLFYEQTNNAF